MALIDISLFIMALKVEIILACSERRSFTVGLKQWLAMAFKKTFNFVSIDLFVCLL